MRDFVYYNGVVTPYDAACVPLSDRALFFGDAVYEVILGRRGIPYQLEEHLTRLFHNAQAIGLDGVLLKNELEEAVNFLLNESEADDFMLYLQLSGKQKRRTHERCDMGTNLLITVTEAQMPDELKSTSAITLPDLRHAYCNIKTTNLLPAVLSVMDARMMECDTAIFYSGNSVTEASAANVSIIVQDLLVTHPLDSRILPGISEANLVRAATELGLRHERREFSIDEMMGADAVLLSSTTKLVKTCSAIDGRELKCSGYATAKAIFDKMLIDFLLKTT